MEMHKSSFEVPSKDYNKQITNGIYSLKIEAGYLNIVDALKSFIDYDKVAIITRHSIRGEDSSASGPLTELGKTAAENVGKQLKNQFGERSITLYSTNTVRTKDTVALINKGWNNVETSEIDTTKSIINGDYFGVSGSWTDIVDNVRTDAIKNKVNTWKSSFISEMPNGLSWWVSHDSLLVPLVYNISDFNPEKYKQLYKFEYLPWVSPLSGIIIAIKNDDIQIKVISCLETGFISSNDYGHDYTEDVENPEELRKKNLVATTFTHPRVDNTYKSKPDLSYIFDQSDTNSNPLYCDSTYEGCGSCVACQNCDSGCQTSCQGCDGCNSCQSCVSCQAKCQTEGYSWTLYKEKITTCSSCVDCRDCVGGYTKKYVTDCNPCNSCYGQQQVKTWSQCTGCQWGCTGCNLCNGCNDGCTSNGQGCVACHDSCTGCRSCNGCRSGCTSGTSHTNSCSYTYSSGCRPCVSCDQCTGCNSCTGNCWGCDGCTACTACQSCASCQTCTASCQSTCYNGCISCNSQTTVTEWRCDGCTQEQPITRCVPGCETTCYAGCTNTYDSRWKRYNCSDKCMTCVGIDAYACTSCYQKNYDVEYK